MNATTPRRPRQNPPPPPRPARRSRTSVLPHASGRELLINSTVTVFGAVLMLTMASVPLAPLQQLSLGVATMATHFVANRWKARGAAVFMVTLSLAMSMRYIVWRITDTLGFTSPLELLLGSMLAGAELYAILVMVLGYMQTIWPLQRRPIPLPDDVESWPTVDVYIPTYNESMDVVRATVLGAMKIDWPPDKMAIYLLDDGKREEFRAFAAACGVGYIARTDNRHAKAGNLNHAMTQTKGEFIAIFDCDHIPTCAFLQVSMGWLVDDTRMAMVQTPHHFYSPDPFQRNLAAGTRVPPEGNLFYGLIQDGNDYWNAAFFCGSCAVLRRTALEEIGGFAVETVTEDAHTMLKLHMRGWDSAYLRIPLAAGLSTERLAHHIAQRIRWARGMLQIFRISNPLLAPGLAPGQRLCYFQALFHFFFALPRTIFLLSPLGYLLLGQNIIAASPLAIFAYAFPHFFHTVATNSRLQKNWRHSFWSEIYETVLALFLLRVTVVTMLFPKRGKFNVTTKGGLLENGYFDLRAVYPNLILVFFLIAGVTRGIGTLLLVKVPTLTFQAMLLNSLWATFSLIVVMGALAVGREKRQVRARHRVRARVPVAIYLEDGRVLTGHTHDMSLGGCLIESEKQPDIKPDMAVQLEFEAGMDIQLVPGQLLRWHGSLLQVTFTPRNIADEASVVAAVFGRPDAWKDWGRFPDDQPLVSIWRVIVSIKGLFRPRDSAPVAAAAGKAGLGADLRKIKALALSKAARRAARTEQEVSVDAESELVDADAAPARRRPAGNGVRVRPLGEPLPPPEAPPAGGPISRFRRRRPLPPTAAALLLGALLLAPTVARAQLIQSRSLAETVRPVATAPSHLHTTIPAPTNTTAAPSVPLPPLPVAGAAGATNAGGATLGDNGAAGITAGPGAITPGNANSTVGPSGLSLAAPGVPAGQTRRLVYTLHQLGAQGPVALRGVSRLQGVRFGIRSDEVVVAATLTVSGASSPALIPAFSNDTITLNEQYVGTIPVVRDAPRFQDLTFPISPVFFQDNNRLNFRFTGLYTTGCNDPLSDLLWSTISDYSTLALTLERLPPQRNLSRLPLPFFDKHDNGNLVLPFVLGQNPSDSMLQLAGVVSSWFGDLASYRRANFPVRVAPPPGGNAVMLVIGNQHAEIDGLPDMGGPTIAEIPNPRDHSSTLLVVGGPTLADAKAAVEALVVGSQAMAGSSALVQAPNIPPRKPYDAPNWIPTNRPVKFGALVDATDLQGTGYVPGTINVPFATAPDLYTWRNLPFKTDVRFRAPPGPILDLSVSRLDVGINNLYLTSFPFALDSSRGLFGRLFDIFRPSRVYQADIPPYYVFGENKLQFFFDARPLVRGRCVAVPQDLRMVISPDSTLNLTSAYHFTQLPNLAFFVGSGFPFTRMADLSDTAVVLPPHPAAAEMTAYLDVMGRMGSITGYPALRVSVVHPDGLARVAKKNLLVIGSVGDLGGAEQLFSKSPIQLAQGRIAVDVTNDMDSIRRIFDNSLAEARDKAATRISQAPAADAAYLIGTESPLADSRSVVALVGGSPAGLSRLVLAMRDPDKVPLIQGDLSILSGDNVSSYRVGSRYTVGHLPFWVWPSWYLRDSPGIILAMILLSAGLLAMVLYWVLKRHAIRRVGRSFHG